MATIPNNEQNKKIVFVLSLAGRFTTFVRFLNNYQEVCTIIKTKKICHQLKKTFSRVDLFKTISKYRIINCIF